MKVVKLLGRKNNGSMNQVNDHLTIHNNDDGLCKNDMARSPKCKSGHLIYTMGRANGS